MKVLRRLLAATLPLAILALAGMGNATGSTKTGVLSRGYTAIPSVITENYGQYGSKMRFKTSIRDVDYCFFPNEVNSVLRKFEGTEQSNNANPESPYRIESGSDDIKIDSMVIKSIFLESNPDVMVEGTERLPFNNNYFSGRNPDSWWTNVPNYSGVIYRDIYPGIDLHYYWHEGYLKYDFIINSGADISRIKIRVEGADRISVTPDGDLAIESDFETTYEKAPVCYQEISDRRLPVTGQYKLLDENTFGFAVTDGYNSGHDLIVDPQLVFSTYIYPGRGYWDQGLDLALDSEGSVYVTGKENSSIFVTKFNNTDNFPVFFTNIGNNQGLGAGIAVDDQQYIYVTGRTSQPDFPVINAYDNTYNGEGDAFLLKLSPLGDSLIFCTYFGGSLSDSAATAVIDNTGNISFAGLTLSQDFPAVNGYDLTPNGGEDGFVAKFNSQGNSLLFSTFLGGNYKDKINDIAVDQNGDLYLIGSTKSWSFPTVNAYDDCLGNLGWSNYEDAFVTKLSSDGDSLVYSTFLGAGYSDFGYGIDVDASGSAYVIGTNHYAGFPLQNPYDSIFTNVIEAFITKFSPAGDSLIFSTYLGGDWSSGYRIAVDQYNCAYVTGFTGDNFPLVDPIDSVRGDPEVREAFLSKFTESGECLLYSSYFGGDSWECINSIAVSDSNEVWITGWAGLDIPLVNPYDSTFNGGYWDVFLSRFDFESVTADYGTLEGFVDDANTGYPIPRVQIRIIERDEILNTDSLGEFILPAVCGGYYSLEFSHIEYIDTILTGISIVPGESSYVEVSMWRKSAIGGIVYDEAYNPIENAIVTCSATPDTGITGTDGSYFLDNILPGSYDIYCDHNDFCDTAVFDVGVDLGQTTYVDVPLSFGGYLIGVVTDSVTGEPIDSVRISALSQYANDTTAADGIYILDGLCPGTVDVSFDVPYYLHRVVNDVAITYGDTAILDIQLTPLQHEVVVWIGNSDGSPITAHIGERLGVDVYAQTADSVYIGFLLLQLASQDIYFDSLLSSTEGLAYYPMSDWTQLEFYEPYSGPELPAGWSSQTFIAYDYDGPWLHCGEPTRISTFVLKTVFDQSIIGDTVDCFANGYDQINGSGPLLGDTTFTVPYPTFVHYSPVVFAGAPPSCQYVVGDVNNSGNYNGLDVTYSVTYFKGGYPPPFECYCPPHGYWYAAGDVNGSCTYNGLDVTYGIAYFKGGPGPVPCPDCPPEPGTASQKIQMENSAEINQTIKRPNLQKGNIKK